MGGEEGAARQLVGLLRGGPAELAAHRVARLVTEACAGVTPPEATRLCASLRDSLLQLCESGSLSAREARVLCREIDAALAALPPRTRPRRKGSSGTAALLAGDAPHGRMAHALRTFESLVDASPLPIVAIDQDGLVQLWNRAAEDLFGWRRAEVMERPLPLPADAEDARSMQEDVRAGRVVRNREVRWACRDGTRLDLALSIAPLRDGAGAVRGAISILMDISVRKHREEEIARTVRFREHLLGIVSHDLRNPLTAIVTSAQLLLRYGELPERQGRVVARMAASADRMARMIDDLLDFARTRLGGELPIHPRRVDLRQICEQTVEELEFGYTRQVKLQCDGDPWGDWDPDRMAQVISNLVGNALQHSDGEVSVALRGEKESVVLATHNGGTPIPSDVLPHVFEPGRRGNPRPGGLGLGLFIAQQIVLAHGGNIEVTSNEADGTSFTVELPRKGRRRAGPEHP